MNTAWLLVICVIGIVQAGILTDEQKKKIIEYGKQCLTESNVELDLAIKAAKGEYVDDPKLKKQILCFNKKIGAQKANGDIDEDIVKTRLTAITKDNKKTEEIMKKCAIKKDTPEETAFGMAKCLHQMAPQENIFE